MPQPSTEPPPANRDTPATSRRRWWLWAAAAAVATGVGFVLFWFQPQKLLIDDRVDEAFPTVAAPTTSPAPPEDSTDDTRADPPSTMAPPTEPATLGSGDFVSRDHATTGLATVIDPGDGQRILRLEDLDTDNGPDLYVYLSTNPADGPEGAFDDEYVNLGRLKGNQGNQNYDIPADVDLDRLVTVVIWCDRFDSAFGAAALTR